MHIEIAKNSGFCLGVKNAIDTAKSIDGGCYTYGKLIHNEYVIKELEKLNIFSIENLNEIIDKNKVLLIRTHGIPKQIYEDLNKLNINYVDATCPFVKKIHEIVEDNYKLNRKIIIVGNKKHPEVIGTASFCNNDAIIIEDESDIPIFDKNAEYCLVCQTTFSTQKYENIIKIIKNACNLVVNKNTICYTTTCRQEEAKALSLKSDIVLVIGSKTSSNTMKLYEIASKNAETYLIENIADLKSVKNIRKNTSVGILAGASTPQELIMEVKTQMSESQEIKNVIVENVEKVKEQSFADLYNSKETNRAMNVKPGQLFKDCKVISADETGIKINFGGKKDGFIPADEAEVNITDYVPENYKEGDLITAKSIVKPAKAEADVFYFSKRVIEKVAKDWEEYAVVLSQPEFKAEIKEAVKSGLKAKVGPYDVFIPSSQIKKGYVADQDLQKYVGKTLRLRAIKSNKDNSEGPVEIKPKKTVYASQRVITEEENEAKEKALWEYFVPEKIVTGKVVRTREFGAFVKVNGFECLAHRTNLSYKKDAKPEDVVEIGKSYEFIILSVDKEKRQVSLGYKQLQKSLYEEAAEKYPVGSTVTGPIKSITDYGVYVLIEDGVDGLVPVSEISRKYVKNPADVCKVDEVVSAQVIKFDVAKNKITLSMKALIPEEETIEVTEEDVKNNAEKRTARNMKKFDNIENPKKKTTKAKKEELEDQQTFVSETSSVSVGDLLKSIINLED